MSTELISSQHKFEHSLIFFFSSFESDRFLEVVLALKINMFVKHHARPLKYIIKHVVKMVSRLITKKKKDGRAEKVSRCS